MINRQISWFERAEKVVNRVNAAFPNPEFENWGLCEELILSATIICNQIKEFQVKTKDSAFLLCKIAKYLGSKASYSSSFPVYQIGLDTRAKIFDILDWSSNMDIDNTQKTALLDSKQAKISSKEIVDIWERVLKTGHPSFANNINNINYLDSTKQNYIQALLLYQQALNILKENVGEMNPIYKVIYEEYTHLKEGVNKLRLHKNE